MPKKIATTRTIDTAKPAEKTYKKRDGLIPALYYVIRPTGVKSVILQFRFAGRQEKLTLGNWEVLGLSGSREAAKVALRQLSEGINPKSRKQQAGLDRRDLVENVVAEFTARHLCQLRSAKEVERLLQKNVVPVWQGRRIQSITRRDVIELMDALTDRGLTAGANTIFAATRKLFNWAIERDIIEVSPCSGLRLPATVEARDRVLTDEELRLFWSAANKLGYPFGSIDQLLALTGQRRSEVAGMVWDEIDHEHRVWTIPRERAKNNEAHTVPLSDAAMRIIESLPRFTSTNLLFSTNGRSRVSGYSKVKRRLDQLIRGEAGGTIVPWRLHDLRRTAASGMARIGIALPTIEKVLNHTSGSFAGIVGVYQRHSYSDEKRAALDAWASYVERLVNQVPGTNVVQLEARG
jgi:integrase